MRSSTPGMMRPVSDRQSISSGVPGSTPRGGIDTAATGLVSVMPQPCTMRMPKCSWNASISARGTAAPPHMTRCRDEKSTSWLSA